MLSTAFEPAKSGFHFSNGTFKTHVGPANCSVLCGGMAYAVLDYIYTGILAPESTAAPAEGNPLETYLYRRQVTAHFYTWHKFTAAWSTGLPVIGQVLAFAGVGQSDYTDLQSWLARKVPVVLCLFDGIGEGHHVVAIGCDPSKRMIQLYDSNHPNRRAELTERNGRWHHSVSNRQWKGWFIDWGYYTEKTRQPPVAWRFCGDCKGLHTTRFGQIGNCPAGGKHSVNAKFEYFLQWNMDEGQRRWYVCKKCQAPVESSGDPAQGSVCPAGGRHELRSDELAVSRDKGLGEGKWYRCRSCSTLYWAGAGNHGVCPKGGQHNPQYSPEYFLDYRTV
jgi:hypothetical protein